jgi:2-polyprenyl-6-methoxyphenol hydroxylase-like FAD-dependent oxidoreductase
MLSRPVPDRGVIPAEGRAAKACRPRPQAFAAWQQFTLLSGASSRCPRWYRPGLLLIGDSAHTMTPVAGSGIKYAIEDALVAANVLTGPLRAGRVRLHDLAEVQRQRE